MTDANTQYLIDKHASVWLTEWYALTAAQKYLVIRDQQQSDRTVQEIANDVGDGNLAAYAKTLQAGRRQEVVAALRARALGIR
jgi:uncharacterized protein YbaA (DUF1428 family)